MRIGIDIRLKNETGVGRYIRNLITYLPQMDKKNEYIFIHPNIPWHSIKEQIKMPQIINYYNIDLMHFPYFNVPIMYSKPYVVTIHDLIINHFSSGRASTRSYLVYKIKRLGYLYVLSNALKNARSIIVPSKSTKKLLINDYPGVDKEKIVVTYEGIDTSIIKKRSFLRENIKILTQHPYFLYVGNAYPHKNLDFLIEAFSKIKNSSVALVLVGKLNYFYYQLLQKIKKTPIKDRVYLTGDVKDSELGYLYQHAIALVIPSLMEGFGLPALEAMYLGCPIAVSDIPSLREICGDAGFYFNPYKIENLYTILNNFVKKNPRVFYKRKIKIGKQISTGFSWKKMTKETIQVYERSFGL